MTDNELIAQFMDMVPNPYDKWTYSKKEDTKTLYGQVYGEWHPISKFETSWDWLMPVVEKISQHVYETYKEDVDVHDRAYLRTFGMIDNEGKWMVRINRSSLFKGDTLIEATYKAVIEFIKWYNSQTTKQ